LLCNLGADEKLAAPPQLTLAPAQAAMLVVTFTRGLAGMKRVYGDRSALSRAADGLIRALVVGE